MRPTCAALGILRTELCGFRIPPRASRFSNSRACFCDAAGAPRSAVGRFTEGPTCHDAAGGPAAGDDLPRVMMARTMALFKAYGYAAAALVAGSPESRRRVNKGG